MQGLGEIAVIGAGPYALSIAAHLSARNVPHRIFGKAMETWSTQMPKGMLLKSDGFATSLYDPGRTFTLERYCRERNIAYADLGAPVRLGDFIDYGRAFQRRFVPHLEEVLVKRLDRQGNRYRLQLETGAECAARSVIVAAGISHFAALPEAVSGMPKTLVTHTSDHHDLTAFKGQKVAVIGAGASAADVAGLLHEAGADAHLIARGPLIPFHTKMRLPRPLKDRVLNPGSKIGPGWRSLLMTKFPHFFRHLPEAARLRIVRIHLGPAPGYFMRDRVIGRVTVHLEHELVAARPHENGVVLILSSNGGQKREFYADHVICGTGYKPQLSRLPFLAEDLLSQIKSVEGAPVLSGNFEVVHAWALLRRGDRREHLGPVLRFACGAEFAAPRLARHLSRHNRLAPPPVTAPAPEIKANLPGVRPQLPPAVELPGLAVPEPNTNLPAASVRSHGRA